MSCVDDLRAQIATIDNRSINEPEFDQINDLNECVIRLEIKCTRKQYYFFLVEFYNYCFHGIFQIFSLFLPISSGYQCVCV